MTMAKEPYMFVNLIQQRKIVSFLLHKISSMLLNGTKRDRNESDSLLRLQIVELR